MSCAIALQVTSQSLEPDGRVSIQMLCAVCDEATNTYQNVGLDVRVPPDATPNDIENAIEEEIIYRAGLLDPPVTVARGDMVYPVLKRGQ